MKKAILISIQPEWVAKILNGEKTIEIRKNYPKCDLPVDVYIYCTKKSDLFKSYIRMGYFTNHSSADDMEYNGKGKVVAKFTLNRVSKIYGRETTFGERYYIKTKEHMSGVDMLNAHNKLRVDAGFHYDTFLGNYFDNKLGELKYEREQEHLVGYAWHIDNLIIKETPLPLQPYFDLDKAPQSWQYICEATYEIRN